MRPATRASRGSAYPFRGRPTAASPRVSRRPPPGPQRPRPRRSSGRAANPASRPRRRRPPAPDPADPGLAPLVYETQRRVDALRDTLDGLSGASDRLREVAQVVVEDHGRALVRLERATAQGSGAAGRRRAGDRRAARTRARRGRRRPRARGDHRARAGRRRPGERAGGDRHGSRPRRAASPAPDLVDRRPAARGRGSRDRAAALRRRRRGAGTVVAPRLRRPDRARHRPRARRRGVRVDPRSPAGLRHRRRGRPLRRRRRRRGRPALRGRGHDPSLQRSRDDRRRHRVGAGDRRARRHRQAPLHQRRPGLVAGRDAGRHAPHERAPARRAARHHPGASARPGAPG